MNDQIERFAKMSWDTVSPVARQKVIDNGEKRVRLLELATGFREQHWCQRGHTGYVIHGVLDVEFEQGSAQQFETGETLLISRGQAHKASVNSGNVRLFLIDDV